MQTPPIPWNAFIAAVVAGVVAATSLALVGTRPWLAAGRVYADAIERGKQAERHPPIDPEAVEDETVFHDANEAGYRWAEQRGLVDPGLCPAYTTAFQAGCIDWTKEARPGSAISSPR